KEGFDAQMITCTDQSLALFVPQSEREHPIEALRASLAPLAIGHEDDLSVRPGPEHVAQGSQLSTELDVIINLTIEDKPLQPVGCGHRLRGLLTQIDDRQSPMS